ncbi:Very-long-chain 3-oxoacyl-CoA reductase, partial [Neolecta irregularis DAH-3]
TEQAKEVDVAFPEALKEPVLRRVQFSTITRIDRLGAPPPPSTLANTCLHILVDHTFEQFHNEYFPGEQLILTTGGYRYCDALIREKTKFTPLNPENAQAVARYKVEYIDMAGKRCDEIVDSSALRHLLFTLLLTSSRDRKIFSKHLLRSFLKHAIHRKSYSSAPWEVKNLYATRYKIDTAMPDELRTRNKKNSGPSSANCRGPVEDLEIPWVFDGTYRPPVKKDRDNIPDSYESATLQVWTFLNVFSEPLLLELFTLDDFIDALKWTVEFNSNQTCLLTDEVFAVLVKTLALAGHDFKIPPKTPRSYKPLQKTNDLHSISTAICLDWRDRVLRGDFGEGGWEVCLLGLLAELEFSTVDHIDENGHSMINRLLDAQLDSNEQLPDPNKTAYRVSNLDFTIKIRILQILVGCCERLPLIRNYLDECAASMTEARKNKVDAQQRRKQMIEQIGQCELGLKQYNITPLSPSHVETLSEATSFKDDDASESLIYESSRTSSKRKRVIDSPIEEKQTPSPQILKLSSTPSQTLQRDHSKLVRELNIIEDEIKSYDQDLRESDCYRVKLLGYDRFYFRYWWFENSAMPYYGGVECGCEPGYGNGRLWIQMPSQEDINSFYDEKIRQRLEIELQDLVVWTGVDAWGFYDSPDEIEALIGWLNPKGIRESRLKSNLRNIQDILSHTMRVRQVYLASGDDDETESEVRRSTRNSSNDADFERELPFFETTGKEIKEEEAASSLFWRGSLSVPDCRHKGISDVCIVYALGLLKLAPPAFFLSPPSTPWTMSMMAFTFLTGLMTVSYFTVQILSFLHVYLKPSRILDYKTPDSYALVTGATDGIGRAMAIELYRLGFHVIIHGRNKEKLRDMKIQLKEQFPKGGKISIVIMDALEEHKFESVINTIKTCKISVLVNNIGGYHDFGPFARQSTEGIRMSIWISSIFTTTITNSLVNSLTRPGLILNVGCTAGDKPLPFAATYSGVKSFLLAWSTALSQELQEEGIQVVAMLAGRVRQSNDIVNVLVPTPEGFAKAALARVGCGRPVVIPCFSHAVQHWLGQFITGAATKRQMEKMLAGKKATVKETSQYTALPPPVPLKVPPSYPNLGPPPDWVEMQMPNENDMPI